MRTTTVKVQRWSDGLAVRLPSSVVRDLRLTPGQSVQVSCRGGIITMTLPRREPSLRDSRVERRVSAPTRLPARLVACRARAYDRLPFTGPSDFF